MIEEIMDLTLGRVIAFDRYVAPPEKVPLSLMLGNQLCDA